MATTTVFNIGPHFIAREIKPFLCISCPVFLKVNIFFQRWTLPLNKYNTYCPLWNSFNGKFKCLNEKSIMLWLILLSRKNKMNCELMLTYDTPALWQTGSRNLTGPKKLPTIWGTYMKLVTKYQISAINSCWEKCDEKCAYMLNVYKSQLSRQTGSRNLMGPKIRFVSSIVAEKNVT